MLNGSYQIRTSTPGRICLFGEHQDYLGLPIIAAAISLRIEVLGSRRNDNLVEIDLPDMGGKEEFSLKHLNYTKDRDYFKSAINVLKKHGFKFSRGFKCKVHGDIPVNAGAASSSALIVSWINFLAKMSDQGEELEPNQIAELAYEAEVLEFSEPGGMMDHYSTALGGTIYLESYPSIRVEKIDPDFGAFVLGDSGQPKDTTYILARVKHGILNALKKIEQAGSIFDIRTASLVDLESIKSYVTPDEYNLLAATLENRDITLKARELVMNRVIDHEAVGRLLTRHHEILRDALDVSTRKIDAMINAALDAGALGAKINGSGGGGCMFAYAPHDPEKVRDAISAAGGRAYIINVDVGTTIDEVWEASNVR
ncbi:MAG: mevalonate kinase family protein [Bacteroidota bacterium]